MMTTILLVTALAYGAVLALLYAGQRSMMYVPDRSDVTPAQAGLPEAAHMRVRTADQTSVILWHIPPAGANSRVFIYFHGNAGQIAGRAERFRLLTSKGDGLLALSYRGYGPSAGSPTEHGLITDARAALAKADELGYARDRIVLVGESLGTGVAVALAAEEKVAGLVLEAPFSSASHVAASVYWMFPVSALMKDPFHSVNRIPRIRAPVLILHGTADTVVPIRFGERLYAAANEPKTFIRLEGGGHQVLESAAAMAALRKWLAVLPQPGNSGPDTR